MILSPLLHIVNRLLTYSSGPTKICWCHSLPNKTVVQLQPKSVTRFTRNGFLLRVYPGTFVLGYDPSAKFAVGVLCEIDRLTVLSIYANGYD